MICIYRYRYRKLNYLMNEKFTCDAITHNACKQANIHSLYDLYYIEPWDIGGDVTDTRYTVVFIGRLSWTKINLGLKQR